MEDNLDKIKIMEIVEWSFNFLPFFSSSHGKAFKVKEPSPLPPSLTQAKNGGGGVSSVTSVFWFYEPFY